MNHTDKGAEHGTNSGTDNAIENGTPDAAAAAAENLYGDMSQTDEPVNREHLKKTYTGKELAKMAQPYTSLKLSTLEGMRKDDLIDIIASKGKQSEEKKSKPRGSSSQSDFATMIDFMVTIADQFKMSRDGEPNPAFLSDAFKTQAVAALDAKEKEGVLSGDSTSTLLLIGTGTALAVNTIGFERIAAVGKKAFGMVKKKPKGKEEDREQGA